MSSKISKADREILYWSAVKELKSDRNIFVHKSGNNRTLSVVVKVTIDGKLYEKRFSLIRYGLDLAIKKARLEKEKILNNEFISLQKKDELVELIDLKIDLPGEPMPSLMDLEEEDEVIEYEIIYEDDDSLTGEYKIDSNTLEDFESVKEIKKASDSDEASKKFNDAMKKINF